MKAYIGPADKILWALCGYNLFVHTGRLFETSVLKGEPLIWEARMLTLVREECNKEMKKSKETNLIWISLYMNLEYDRCYVPT